MHIEQQFGDWAQVKGTHPSFIGSKKKKKFLSMDAMAIINFWNLKNNKICIKPWHQTMTPISKTRRGFLFICLQNFIQSNASGFTIKV